MHNSLRMLLVGALALLFAASSSPAAAAQGGWDTVKLPEHGLTFKMARDYDPIPVDPLEKFAILIYEEERAKVEKLELKAIPRMTFIEIDHSIGVASPTTGEDAGEEGEGGEEGEEVVDEDEEPAEEEAVEAPINNLERYIEREMRGWELGLETEGKDKGEYSFVEYEMEPKKGKWIGVCYAFSNTSRTIAIIGLCHEDDLKREKKIWDSIVKKLKIVEPNTGKVDKEAQKQLDAYIRKGYLDPEFRVEARAALPKGWKAEDTENYILVYDTKDQPLLRLIKSELEAIRKEYEKLFPPLEPVTAVSQVRICKDQQEYFSYGGPKGSGGYWNYMAEELVFFDYANVDGKAGTGKANSRIVLYHEAFHQFIYYSAGSFSPHSWFNEGTGDFFSGALIRGGKVKKIGVNPWRVETAQEAIKRDRYAPWKDIVRWTQREYYGQNSEGLSPGLNYAQGWSMIYFLRESKVAQRHPVWSQILDTYFNTLRDTYNEGMAQLEEQGLDGDAQAVNNMEQDALNGAVDAAFEDVDYDEIEEAWKEFTLGLKVPR